MTLGVLQPKVASLTALHLPISMLTDEPFVSQQIYIAGFPESGELPFTLITIHIKPLTATLPIIDATMTCHRKENA